MIDVSTIRQLHRNALLRAATMWFIAVGTTTAVLAGAAALTSTSPPEATQEAAPARVVPALTAEAVTKLDPLPPVTNNAQPKSPTPAGGIAFVRCTKLWRAMPDGSEPRLVLEIPGISSPTFAPNARTIAFLKDGREIWMATAEGQQPTKVGDIAADGALPEGIGAINLTWSPNGEELAFALVAQGANQWTGGAAIWTLDLKGGTFDRDGFGWPTPAWQGNYLSYPMTGGMRGPYLSTESNRSDRLMARGGTPLGAVFNRQGWQGIWGEGVATIRSGKHGAPDFIDYRRSAWDRHVGQQILPPAGFVIATNAQPAISQDSLSVFVDLLDASGDPVLGIYNVRAESWTRMDYAWQADTSPAPTSTRRLAERRAMWLANDLLARATRGGTRLMLVKGNSEPEPSLQGFKNWIGRVFGEPSKTPNGWKVSAFVFGQQDDGPYLARKLRVDVIEEAGRLEAKVGKASAPIEVTTTGAAVRVLDEALPEADIILPTLPAGTVLHKKWPIDAWTWRQGFTGTLNFKVPKADGGWDQLAFAFGDVNLSLGCGGVMDPRDEYIGVQAVSDHMEPTRQIVWPATTDDLENGSYTVYGSLPKEILLELAREMVARGAH